MGSKGKKILIIDDEIDLCILMKGYLVKKGYEVNYAHSLSEGIRKMEELVPDILFLDNNLPDGTGWTSSNRFFSVNPALKLFLMSGYQPNTPDLRDIHYNVIHKPISFSDLEILAEREI